ncbi:hypothetical protein P7228_00500 [Altererythrobacter arenosus]|uniref:DUF4142 domain-containing protein n=1 Tax=Altererythrobacter arenosus TaxID=3032592 RepID=A0ABY8FRE2_9SPHN|nr:hypothetical protein [Altererythrobacter sp. CAU 1644]WFL77577.1 hypothetical protein P7228_00500 [Altererythrobacter sp. CAU 1644]
MNRPSSHRYPFVLLACTVLGACAGSSDRYPSLAVRDAERVSGSFAAPAESDRPAPAAASAEMLASVDSLLAAAQSSHQQFLSAAPGAERTVGAAGSGPGSNSWAAAQVALADLDSQRSETAIALGELDLMFTDATLGFVEREQIGAARERVVMLVSEEDAVLARLRGRLAQ